MMIRFRTLRARFALWVAGLLLAVLIIFGAFVYFALAQGLYASIDDSLRLSASQAIAAVNIENGEINFSDSIPEGSAAANLRERGVTIQILTLQGQVFQSFGPYRNLPISSDSLATVILQQPTFTTTTGANNQDRVRAYAAPIIENGQLIGIVQVVQSLGTVTETLNRLLTALLVGGALLTLAASLGGYFLVARALAPIDRITSTARNIANGANLSARLNLPATDDEVGRLAATFDMMLARLDNVFRRERQFTADASHELRTPLAAMQAILSVICSRRRTPEDYEQALTDLTGETDRLRDLIESLLLLARGDANQKVTLDRVDLSALLVAVVDSMRSLAEDKGLDLRCSVPSGLTLTADGDALIRLFVNLLDNAVKYTDFGTITLQAEKVSDNLIIQVTDTGLGISPEHLPLIFDRFYRVELARATSGSGLGLAIALDIAQAHGGTIEVSSEMHKGSTFTVQLPQRRVLAKLPSPKRIIAR